MKRSARRWYWNLRLGALQSQLPSGLSVAPVVSDSPPQTVCPQRIPICPAVRGSFHFTLPLPEGLKSTSNKSLSNSGRQRRFFVTAWLQRPPFPILGPQGVDQSGSSTDLVATSIQPGPFKERGNGPTSLTACSPARRQVSNEYLT